MEESILDRYTTGKTPSRVDIGRSAIERVNARYSPITNIKTEYDRTLADTPVDDYESMYLINRDTPEETLKDKSYMSDAFTTFMNNRDQINLMSERAKLVKDINPGLNDIDYELNFLNDKKKLKNLENTIQTLDPSTQEYANAATEYRNLQTDLAARQAQYSTILNKNGEVEGTDIEARIKKLQDKQNKLLEDQTDVNADINDYYTSLSDRADKYKPSAAFQLKEQKAQDKPWYSPDYFLYAGPGLTGSSTATVEGYMASALATGALWLGSYYAATNVANVLPGVGVASNLIGWGGALTAMAINLTGNLYSRHRESLAQVYGAYKTKVEDNLKSQGIDINQYAQVGRDELAKQNPNIDVNKISDEEIVDRVLSGEIRVNDEALNNARNGIETGLQRVYDNNMTLSAMDVAESALIFAPLGKAMGKVISAPIKGMLKPLSKLSTSATAKYNNLIDAYTGFNARLAYNAPKKFAALQGAKALSRMGFAAGGEMFEEGAQDVFDYDYVAGKYDGKSSSVFQSLMGLADANFRVAKILSGIDTESELANDPQFWNDVKGGFALGLYMGGPTTAYHSGIKTYKDMAANKFVKDVVADQIGKKDAMNKAMAYSDRANKKLNYNESVIDVLNNYKTHLPEGITEEDIDAEIQTAQNVFSLSKSREARRIGKYIGYEPGTTEYNTMIGLQHMAQVDLQEATANLKSAQDSDSRLYTDLMNDASLTQYTDDEKLAAATLTKLNTQKIALEQLKTALEATPEDGTAKFGVTNKENPVAKSLLKSLPGILKNIDKQANQISEGTRFNSGFIAAPQAVQKGIDSYVNLLMAEHDALVSESKMHEMFGNSTQDGKLISFNNASEEKQKSILYHIKKRVDDYMNNSVESSKVVEDNAKKVVETELAKEEATQAQEDNNAEEASTTDTLVTDNETLTDTQIAEELAKDETTTPQTTILDSRAKPAVDTTIPLDEETAPKSLEELSKEFEENKRKVKENAEKGVQDPEPQPQSKSEEEQLFDDEEEFESASSNDLRAAANEDAGPLDKKDSAVGGTYDSMPHQSTLQERSERQADELKKEEKLDKLNDVDSESRYQEKDEIDDFYSQLEFEVNDKVSHTLFFDPLGETPLMPGLKTGKELAEQIKDPKFFSDSTNEFIINTEYIEKGGKPYKAGDKSTYNSASILMIVHHSTGDYGMALRTPKGADTFLTYDPAFQKLREDPVANEIEIGELNMAINQAVANLTDFRNAIINALENKKEGEIVVPGTITRTNGEPNVSRKGNRAVLRPVQAVKGFAIPQDPYQITPENVTFGISSGIANRSLIVGVGGEILPGTGGSGQVFIYPPKSNTLSGRMLPLQVNPQRFTRQQAEFLTNFILNYGATPTAEVGTTGIPANEVINFMVRFGDKTKMETEDPRYAWLRDKQFYINEKGDLVIGTKTYNRGNISDAGKREITEAIMLMHWRIGRKNLYEHLANSFPTVKERFMRDTNLNELELIPGFPFTREQFLGNSEHGPMYTMGWIVNNNLLTSDLHDQLFKNSFAYANDIQTIPAKLNDKVVEQTTANKAENATAALPSVPEATATPEEVAEQNSVDEISPEDKKIVDSLTDNGKLDPFRISEDDDIDIPEVPRRLRGTIDETVSQEEIEWFKNKLGLQGDSLTLVDDAIALGGNEYAMGLVRENSTLLWKGAERGTLYHEAFHRISLLTISPKERKSIYDFYRKQNGFEGTDVQLEESLAEDFRQYMLNKVEPELNIVKRAWKAIKNFINKWIWKTDATLDNIYGRIESGYYNRSKNNSKAVNEFLATYNGQGAPFKYRGHKFKHIGNIQFKETVNSLVASLFSLSSVRMRDDLHKLNYGVLKEALSPDRTETLANAGQITADQANVRNEIFETFDTVFKPAIIEKLADYSIRAVEKQDNVNDEIANKENGGEVGDQMANYTQEQLEISTKSNALTAIKIFIATMPMRETYEADVQQPDGSTKKVMKTRTVYSPVTGLPLMVNFDQSWNNIINELHSENSFKGMQQKSAKLAKVYPIFETLYKELYKISKATEGETENQKIARENMQTQFRNTFRKARHSLVGILSEKVEDANGEAQTNLYVKDESSNKVSKNILEEWNYNLGRQNNLVNVNENGQYEVTLTESGKDAAIDSLLRKYSRIVDTIEKYQKTPDRKLKNGQTYEEYLNTNLSKLKDNLVNLLNEAGISIDSNTLNSYLASDYYNSNPVESFVSMITDGNGNAISNFFFTTMKNLKKIDALGNVKIRYNKHISKYFNDSKFAGRLSEIYGMTHPTSDELSVLSTDGKLLYPISEHNYFTDMVQNLDTDHSVVDKLTTVLYNTGNIDYPGYFKGSYLLTNLYNNPTATGKIGFETLVYFKEQGSADKGRKYTEVSPLEDYIAKMTFTQAGRIILPTMGDSRTYNTIKGTAIQNFDQHLDISNNDIKFDGKALVRFRNYFETELETLEFNYANEGNMSPEQKIVNYDTGNRNGYRFRYFNGFFKLKEQPTFNGIELTEEFTDFNEALALAEDLGGNEYASSIVAQIRTAWNKMSDADKANLMNNYLMDAFRDELNYAQELGIITWDGNKFASIESLALPQTQLEKATAYYNKQDGVKDHAGALAAMELIGNHFNNTISSVIEFEKLFIKDPAYYRDPTDKIKRLREVLSTGVTPRTDYEPGDPMADLTEANVGTLADNKIVSRQADKIVKFAHRSAAIRLLQEMENMTQDEAIARYDSAEALPESVNNAAETIVKDRFDVYFNQKGKINQTDATVLISPEFYKELVRRVDGWTPQVAKAFDILNNPNANYEADAETYNDALAVTLKPLKFMYFGDHYDAELKRNVPIFDKMAMFPVHRIFSDGDMGAVLDVMQKRNIHMLAFDSAVKVGQHVEETKNKIYTDKTNTEIDMESLMNSPIHKQPLANFRRQLITDPHHSDRQMFVSQAQKAAMGNIRDAWKYTTPNGETFTGTQVRENINIAHDAITEYGKRQIEKDFGITPDSPQASVQKFANIIQKKARNSNMNDNVIDGLEVQDGKTVAPITGLSDNAWIESGMISMINQEIADTNLPGGMFIQMSSILYNRLAVKSDSGLTRKLNFVNDDGSMDCVVSINLLKHIIPNYDEMNFSEAKKWLIRQGIVGPETRAIAMGYRIPAQGQSSTAALKVVDVYPEQIGDTITLPDEFTALTGSDFDIDKLFLARYNYKNGKRVQFETKDQYVERLRRSDLDDETIARKAYDRFNNPDTILTNSKEAYENLLLDMYMSIISNPMNFAEAKQSLDVVTDYLRDTILNEIDELTGQTKRQSRSQLYYSTPAFQSRIKSELIGGKTGIGPFAWANSHHVITQLVKLKFAPNKILDGYGISNLHGIQSNDKNKINILDWLSALINAHVDVAKDPYIIRLNVRKLTFNMTNFLIRSGKGENTFYFLPQQILKDFAMEYDKYSGFYNVDIPTGRNPESLARNKVWKDYMRNARKLVKGDFKREAQLDLLEEKGLSQDQRKRMFDVNYLKKQFSKKDDFNWYYNQLQILAAYQELDSFARSMSELTTLSQIDTKYYGNNFGLQSSFLDKWKQYMTEQKVFINPQSVFFDSFLGKKMKEALVFPRTAFQNVMIRLTPEFEANRSLIQYYTKGFAVKDDTYINNITREMEVAYKMPFFKKFMIENAGIKKSLYGSNSISRRLDKLKGDIKSGMHPGLENNVLLNNIFSRPKLDATEMLGPDFIAYTPNKSGDNNLENEVIRAWDELYDYDNKDVRDFARDLAAYSFLTSGDAFGKNNIFRYVPNSIREEIGYFDYIRELEASPESAVSQINDQEVIKNLWWNDHVVPTMEYYKLDSSYETIQEEGRAIYQAAEHDGSDLYILDDRGNAVEVPGIIYDVAGKRNGLIGMNQAGLPIFSLYKKVKLNRNSDPRTTFLYKYIGTRTEDDAPVYQLINKKGLNYKGNFLMEYGFNRSAIPYNNIIPAGHPEILPTEDVTYVTDVAPLKASLKAKTFNEGGQLDPAIFYEYKNNTRKSKLNQGDATQQALNFEENSESTSRRTYSGKITELKDNQVFVFGSNTEGRHGKGAALDAKRKFGAIYGQAEGPQGQSYAIITKDLTKRTHPSRTPEQIKEQIHNLYEYAKENPDKEFLVAYSGTGQNLNAYSNQEIADMFNSEPIPNNIVFEQEFNKLIPIVDEQSSETINIYAGTGEIEQQIIFVNHSGGANGADSYWGIIGEKYGVKSNHYWYKNVTPTGNTEISEADAVEGQQKVTIAARQMSRIAPTHQVRDERLIRNWSQVKYADAIFAVTTLLNKGDEMNYGKKASIVQGKGGTGYAVQMAINEGKPVYLYDQIRNQWYSNINNTWSKTDTPTLTPNFAGIGTRELNESGKKAIESVYEKIFANKQNLSTVGQPAITDTTQDFLNYANQFGYTAELENMKPELKKAAKETAQVEQNYVYTFGDGTKVKLAFKLNDQQKTALAELEAFVKGSDPSITLSGYAGTGKTTIMGIFYEYLKRNIPEGVIFSAPTHRANAVTRQKTPGATVMTLQSMLGLRPDIDLGETEFNARSLQFLQNSEIKVPENSIVIIDESSMIQDSLYDLIREVISSKNAQVIYMGDKGQLRPVKSNHISKVFENSDSSQIQLTQVERTGDNPILKESTRLRSGEGLSYETDINENGQGVQYTNDIATIRSFVKNMVQEMDSTQDPLHFRILAATNDVVAAYNNAIRAIKYGKRPAQLYKGELLMGYSNRLWDANRKRYKLMNSGDYIVQDVSPTTINVKLEYADNPRMLTMEGFNVTLSSAMDNSEAPFNVKVISNFETNEKIVEVQDYIDYLWKVRKEYVSNKQFGAARMILDKINSTSQAINTMKEVTDSNGRLKVPKTLDYGYAHTIHKSQGGTYSKVLVVDDSIESFGLDNKYGKEIREELRYVAVSRAKNFVLVKTQDKKAIEQTVEESTEDFYNDDIIVYATPQLLNSIASQDAISELSNLGQQRKNECK